VPALSPNEQAYRELAREISRHRRARLTEPLSLKIEADSMPDAGKDFCCGYLAGEEDTARRIKSERRDALDSVEIHAALLRHERARTRRQSQLLVLILIACAVTAWTLILQTERSTRERTLGLTAPGQPCWSTTGQERTECVLDHWYAP